MEARHLLAMVFVMSSPAQATFLDCLGFDGFDGEAVAAPAQWRGNLTVHNCARRSVLPVAATPLRPLTWSTSLAATAQALANQCVYAHSGTAGLGENIAAAAPQSDRSTASAQDWASEFAFYNHAANSCTAGQQCGHYTQMVWSTTTQVGCGMAQCSVNSPFAGPNFQQWTLVFCNYSPAGNNGSRPY